MTAPRLLQDGPVNRLNLPFDGSILVRSNDLMFLDGDDVKPFSSITDQTSLALNQAKYAPLFAGIAAMSRNAADTTAEARFPVITDVVAEYDCASTTWAVGDLVGPVEDSGGTYLENQKVAKVTDPRLAIGMCIKAQASATRVTFLLGANAVKLGGRVGLKVAYGTVTLDGGNPTPVTTGLTVVTGAVVTLKAAATPGDDPTSFSVDYNGTDGVLNIYAYKTNGTDPTLVASTDNAATVNWVAYGY